MKTISLILVVGLIVAACGEGTATTSPAEPPGGATPTTAEPTTAAPTTTLGTSTTVAVDTESPVWGGNVMVIDAGAPVVCLGVLTSLPPQCSGPELRGLDWDTVPWSESAGDVTWASMYLEVEIQGDRLGLVGTPEMAREVAEPVSDRFVPPCPEPPGGWVFESGPRASESALEDVMRYVEAQRDASGAWVYNLAPLSDPDWDNNEPGFAYVLIATFAGDLARHERAIREVWGGPLCVVERPWEERALRRIQRELSDLVFDDPPPGLHWPNSFSVDIVRGVVEVGALIADAQAQQWADETYGPGVVEIASELTEVG